MQQTYRFLFLGLLLLAMGMLALIGFSFRDPVPHSESVRFVKGDMPCPTEPNSIL